MENIQKLIVINIKKQLIRKILKWLDYKNTQNPKIINIEMTWSKNIQNLRVFKNFKMTRLKNVQNLRVIIIKNLELLINTINLSSYVMCISTPSNRWMIQQQKEMYQDISMLIILRF